MSVSYDQYLSRHLSDLATPAAIRRNALFTLEHHGQHLPSDKDAAILEIGPGFGALIETLHTRYGYRNLSGIDISPEAVAACNKILPGSTALVEDAARFLSERPERFDLIFMLHVLEHVPKEQLIPLLAAARNALKKDGKLVVEVPNILHPVAGAYNRYYDFTHTVGFTDQSLRFVLRSSGFQQITVYGCKTPRRNPARLLQRTLQDLVEAIAALRLRLFLPRLSIHLSLALGACATK